jgi:glycosyltransferase involved in cell wall biosynthesis
MDVGKVGIVIPAYQAARWIERSLGTALAQSYESLSIVVVDDGSADDTAGRARLAARGDPRVRVISHGHNKGLSASRNTGFEALTPDVDAVLFLDSDDLLAADAVATLRESLLKNPSAPAAYGLCRFIDAHDRRLPDDDGEFQTLRRFCVDGRNVRLCQLDEPTPFEAFALHNWIFTPGQALIRCSALGGFRFDPALRACEDWALWLELSRKGGLAIVGAHVLDYRRHGSNMSADHPRMAAARKLLETSFLATPTLTERERRILAEARVRKLWVGSVQRFEWAGKTLKKGQLVSGMKQVRHGIMSRLGFHWSQWQVRRQHSASPPSRPSGAN